MNAELEARSPVFEAVVEALGFGALWSVYFDRDSEDNYVIRVDRAKEFDSVALTREDVLPLIPKGSQWTPARGWHSFFGLFLKARDQCWLALGGQRIVGHRSRGAFPIMRAHLFAFEKQHGRTIYGRPFVHNAALSRAVAAIGARRNLIGVPSTTTQVIKSSSSQPSAHASLEASIMEAANNAYQSGRVVQFRTLITCDAEIEEIKSGATCDEGRSEFIGATVPRIVRSFSGRNQRWLNRIAVTLQPEPGPNRS